MAAKAARIDIILGIDEQGREILAGQNPAISIADAWRTNPDWCRIERLCQQWSDCRSELHQRVERIWLEFDLETGDEHDHNKIPVPGIFIDFVHQQDRQRSQGFSLDLAGAFLDAVADAESGSTHWAEHRIHRCFELLPAGCWVPYIGVFPSRQSDTIRFCVRGLGTQQRLDYLRALGWPGADQLAASMSALTEHWGGDEKKLGAVLHLDVAFSEIGPLVGLEFYLERLPQLRGELAEETFLDYLTQQGLCSADKRQALLTWPGYERRTLRHELWPSLVSRRVNHIKLMHDHQRFFEAKGYLCVTHDYHQPAPANATSAQPAEAIA